jgi:adenosylcobinamide-GDP ribazoletransferase
VISVLRIALAFQFLTPLPVPIWRKVSAEEVGSSQRYFPLVGAILGLALVVADGLLTLVFPISIASAMLLALSAALTGALHLDGFADSCDALFGHRDAERRLQIMRDSRIGSFGSVGLITLLLLKYSVLTALTGPLRWPTLVAMTTLGRWGMVYALTWFPYGRPLGAGSIYKDAAGVGSLAVATVMGLAVAVACFDLWGIGLMATALCEAWLVARFTLSRVPGLTGDSYGAINEVLELTVLLAAVAATRWTGTTP